ncbi:MAG: YcaO-like family protein [Hyphomicrobiaceae bacterium]
MKFDSLDLASDRAASLLRAAAAKYGDWLLAAADRLDHFLLLGAEAAPGLWFIGAKTTSSDQATPARSLSVGGGGLDAADAMVACIGEAIERESQHERPGDIATSVAIESLNLDPAFEEVMQQLLGRSGDQLRCSIDLVNARSLDGGDPVLLPADWCLRRALPGMLRIPGAALSTGCAAGTDFNDAAVRALLELIERDAAALWWLGGVPPLGVAAESLAGIAAVTTLEELRRGAAGRRTLLLDISSDLGVPVCAAVSHEADGRGLACGIAARLSPAAAAKAALIEMCQMELGLELARYKQSTLGAEHLTGDDTRHLHRARTIDVAIGDRFRPQNGAQDISQRMSRGSGNELAGLAEVLAASGIAAWLVDLSRPEWPRHVVKAIAPGLQLFPADLPVTRLSKLPSKVATAVTVMPF